MLILNLFGCTNKLDDSTTNELTKEQQQILQQRQLSLYEELVNYCEIGTSTMLEQFAEVCDYKSETKYSISDPILIYDFSSEQDYTSREGKYYFVIFRNNVAINHHRADINQSSISLENVDILTDVFSEKENFAFVNSSQGGLWIVTETKEYLFFSNPFKESKISDRTIELVRSEILVDNPYSFDLHQLDFDELEEILSQY